MTVDYKFPKGFWWGSATSATQIEGAANEGGKGRNIWDHWYEEEPNRFFDNVGPGSISDFYHRYKEDIQLMKEIGHNTFRMSISWSRLIPDRKSTRLNSSHVAISYAVFCLKKKNTNRRQTP